MFSNEFSENLLKKKSEKSEKNKKNLKFENHTPSLDQEVMTDQKRNFGFVSKMNGEQFSTFRS